jgi:hypothetical protein
MGCGVSSGGEMRDAQWTMSLCSVQIQTVKTSAALRRRPGREREAMEEAEIYTLSKAKVALGRLLAKSDNGKNVYIVRGRKRFLLQPVREIEPIPMRRLGYFEFDKEDIELDKKFANANVVPDPGMA